MVKPGVTKMCCYLQRKVKLKKNMLYNQTYRVMIAKIKNIDRWSDFDKD